MKRILILFSILMVGGLFLSAATTGQPNCDDWNGFVASKDTPPGTGAYTLVNGFEEFAAQSYHYSGPGRIRNVRVYGSYPGALRVMLRVGIYSVDNNNRPLSLLSSNNLPWYVWDNGTGYKDVTIDNGGLYVTGNFAVSVEVVTQPGWGTSFAVAYNGDGEGLGQDLASLAGTSTGFNWSSAKDNFAKDGDFYIVPRMRHEPVAAFTPMTACVTPGGSVNFTNNSVMSMDSMFNIIGWSGYTGSNEYYSWDFGDGAPLSNAMNPSHIYAAAGSYTVTLTITLEGWNIVCTSQATAQISVGLGGSVTNSTDVTCNGGADGTVTFSGNNGWAPYTYSLNGLVYSAVPTFTGLSAGTFPYYVQDALGCVFQSTFTINQPPAIVITNIGTTDASCGFSNGVIQVTATGGTGTLNYSINGVNWQGTGTFSGLAGGNYLVRVIDQAGCLITTNVNVDNQGAPVLQILSYTHVSCYGGNDGTIQLLGIGGTGQLQYTIDGINWQASGTFSSVSAGNYPVAVRDAATCFSGLPGGLTINQPVQLQLTAITEPVSCNGLSDGVIEVNYASGGIGAYEYSINGVNWQNQTIFSGLIAGNYTVMIRDVANCTNSVNVTVTEPTVLSALASVTDASCYGSINGEISITASGGTPPYEYSLDGNQWQASNIFSPLAARTYTVWVMDDNGCTISMYVSVGQPTQIAATITTTNSTCGFANGGFLLQASGGSGAGYQYSMDGGVVWNGTGSFNGLFAGSYLVIVEDGSGCQRVFNVTVSDSDGPVIAGMTWTNISCHGGNDGSITVTSVTGGTGQIQYSIDGGAFQLSNMFSGLDADDHTVVVKDANGCTGDSTITLTEPGEIVVLTTVSDVSCNGGNDGEVMVSAAGGAGTLAYSLTGGAPFQGSNVFTGLTAGAYTVTVKDAAGCSNSANFTVDEPTKIESTIGTLNVSCNGAMDGEIHASAIGGTGVFEFSLDNITYFVSGDFMGLEGDTFTVYVMDENGCIDSNDVVVTEPDAIVISSTVTNVSCAGGNDGVIDLSLSGGIAPLTVDWSNGAVTEDIFNLSPGNYSVIVTDDNGCEALDTFVVTQPALPLITNASITDASGAAVADGAINLAVTGGTQPYTFVWSHGPTTEDVTGLLPGQYTVTITDANGCSDVRTFTVGFVTSLDPASMDNLVVLYPNPAQNILNLNAGNLIVDQLEIVDVVGQLVKSQVVDGNTHQVDVSGISNGIYFVRLVVGERQIIKKVKILR